MMEQVEEVEEVEEVDIAGVVQMYHMAKSVGKRLKGSVYKNS